MILKFWPRWPRKQPLNLSSLKIRPVDFILNDIFVSFGKLSFFKFVSSLGGFNSIYGYLWFESLVELLLHLNVTTNIRGPMLCPDCLLSPNSEKCTGLSIIPSNLSQMAPKAMKESKNQAAAVSFSSWMESNNLWPFIPQKSGKGY